MSEIVHASPTKRFFVKSLTRDIALKDAILDLLDNCIDGILRALPEDERKKDDAYNGYWAKITASPDKFTIEDNCGGIPKSVAIDSAFRFGRPSDDIDNDIETVGMYGIGMKRAIFKMGKNAEIDVQTAEENYTVEIPPDWLTNESEN